MQKQLSITAKRVIVASCMVVAFLVMASIFSPSRTKASNADLNPNQNLRTDSKSRGAGGGAGGAARHYAADPTPRMKWYNQENGIEAESSATSTDAHVGLPSLGSLELAGYTIEIYSTDGGARYSVYDKANGKLLDTLLTPAKIHEKYPELNLPETDFSAKAEGPLMLAVPRSMDFAP